MSHEPRAESRRRRLMRRLTTCPYCLTRCGHPQECGAELDSPLDPDAKGVYPGEAIGTSDPWQTRSTTA